MNIINASYKIEKLPTKEDIKLIESAGRVCYKSEDKVTEDSFVTFLERLIKLGHESVLEHSMLTVRFICDRGVSRELMCPLLDDLKAGIPVIFDDIEY